MESLHLQHNEIGDFLRNPEYISKIDSILGNYLSKNYPIYLSDIAIIYGKISSLTYEGGKFCIATDNEGENYTKNIQESDQIIMDTILGLLIIDIQKRLQMQTGKNERISITQEESGTSLMITPIPHQGVLEKEYIGNQITSILDKK